MLHSVARVAGATSTLTYPTATDGCVICPSKTPYCPLCPAGQVCNQLTRTCSTCPEIVCVKVGSSSGSKPIGIIVGGVIGGVGGIAVIAVVYFFLYYKLVYRKKNLLRASIELNEDVDGGGSKGKYQDFDSYSLRSHAPASGQTPRNVQLSSYDSFMRPPRYNRRSGGALSVNGSLAPSGNTDLSKRTSIATTISTSGASNILPIAYIPGVTFRPSKNNVQSIYLYDVELLASEAPSADLLSLLHLIVLQGPTMTAVKAQPRLVNIARIDEGNEPADLYHAPGSHRTDTDISPTHSH